ncbi:MAG TPA: transporter substrate-binding domain-containing protein [Actinomycetes bacterium]
MTRLTRCSVLLGLSVALALLSACGSSGDSSRAQPGAGTKSASGDPSTDKLAQVQARGTLILFTDPAYEPQSYAVEGALRKAPTKCAANELTAPEMAGYDADTAKRVAKALGVEPCFVTPSWTEVTAGNWGDRWDLAYGSGAIAADRMQVLYMTHPYYSTPANFFVPTDSTAQDPADLSGDRVGACAGCTMEDYLRGTLELPGPPIEFLVDQPEVVTFDTEVPGLKATANGTVDAFLCSEPVGAEQIAAGLPLRMLATPAYRSYKTGYADRSSGLSVASFVARVDKVIQRLHADGTLAALSRKYFGKDYATAAGQFDMGAIGQTVE